MSESTGRRELLIAVDGGGTQTRCAAYTLDEDRIAVAHARPSDHLSANTSVVRDSLESAIGQVLRVCEAERTDIRLVSAGFAGVDFDGTGVPEMKALLVEFEGSVIPRAARSATMGRFFRNVPLSSGVQEAPRAKLSNNKRTKAGIGCAVRGISSGQKRKCMTTETRCGALMIDATTYISKLQEILEAVKTQQVDAIQRAGALVAATLEAEGIVHVFGSGHSHLIAEEAFFRAGGLVPVNPILDRRLSFLDGALESTLAERQTGYASRILQREELASNDVAIIISNSGRNAVPVEMAMEMRLKGLKLIAITNLNQSQQSASRHVSGKRLFELADIVIDNCVPAGDAILQLASDQRIGPASTVAGAAIINSVMIEAASELLRKNLPVPVFSSANVDSSDGEPMEASLERYSFRIRYFRSGSAGL